MNSVYSVHPSNGQHAVTLFVLQLRGCWATRTTSRGARWTRTPSSPSSGTSRRTPSSATRMPQSLLPQRYTFLNLNLDLKKNSYNFCQNNHVAQGVINKIINLCEIYLRQLRRSELFCLSVNFWVIACAFVSLFAKMQTFRLISSFGYCSSGISYRMLSSAM